MNAKLLVVITAILLLPVTALAAADIQDIGNLTFPKGFREGNVSTAFTVKNTGDVSLTNVHITDDVNSKYNLVYSSTNLGTLNSSEQRTIEIKVNIPDDEDFGISAIGTITLASDQHNEPFILNLN